jgi:hypothetical protein
MMYENIKIDLTEHGQEGMESIRLAQNKDQEQTSAITIVNIQVLCNACHSPEASKFM